MKNGTITRLWFSVNAESGINFFINPPRGGRPPRESRARENSIVLVGLPFTFLKDERLYRLLVLHTQNMRTLFKM